jgi:hypothetical protein
MSTGPVLDVVVAVHVVCGLVAVLSGLGAMRTRKGGGPHRRFGRCFSIALVGLGLTAPVLAAVDWSHRWHLVALGGAALGSVVVGFSAVRFRRPARSAVHIGGMGSAYIAVLTAFYVDNGPRLPLWDLLPPVLLWLLPALIGVPLTVRAIVRNPTRVRAPQQGGTT